jgi:hypothetical protein
MPGEVSLTMPEIRVNLPMGELCASVTFADPTPATQPVAAEPA